MKQADSPCLSAQCVAYVCAQSDPTCLLTACTAQYCLLKCVCVNSGQCQRLSYMIKKSKILKYSELSPNVNPLDIAINSRAENLIKNSRYSPHSPLRSGHFVWISHCFLPLRVHAASSLLLIDFFLILFRASLLLISVESQSQHRTTSLVRFRCMTLCHQICFFYFRVDVCKIRQLLFHYILHKHVFQHYMRHSSQSSYGCPCFCRLAVDMIHERHFMSQFLQEMFCHHPFSNSNRQSI